MQVICTDGTVLQCQRFEAIDSGVLLFGESRRAETGEEEEAEPEEDEEAMAFVPIHQLRFVLPEGAQPGAPSSQAQPTQQAPPTGAPPTSGTPQQGQVPRRRPTGQSPQGMGQQQSQSGTGQRR